MWQPLVAQFATCAVCSRLVERDLEQHHVQQAKVRICLVRRGEGILALQAFLYGHRGALRGTLGSSHPQSEPNATELPSSAPCHPKLVELQASAPSPKPTRAEENIATTPDCRPRVPAPSPTPTRTGHFSRLQIVRLCALVRRCAPKRNFTLHLLV